MKRKNIEENSPNKCLKVDFQSLSKFVMDNALKSFKEISDNDTIFCNNIWEIVFEYFNTQELLKLGFTSKFFKKITDNNIKQIKINIFGKIKYTKFKGQFQIDRTWINRKKLDYSRFGNLKQIQLINNEMFGLAKKKWTSRPTLLPDYIERLDIDFKVNKTINMKNALFSTPSNKIIGCKYLGIINCDIQIIDKVITYGLKPEKLIIEFENDNPITNQFIFKKSFDSVKKIIIRLNPLVHKIDPSFYSRFPNLDCITFEYLNDDIPDVSNINIGDEIQIPIFTNKSILGIQLDSRIAFLKDRLNLIIPCLTHENKRYSISRMKKGISKHIIEDNRYIHIKIKDKKEIDKTIISIRGPTINNQQFIFFKVADPIFFDKIVNKKKK